MEKNFWICECGNANDGRFCSSCGRERPAVKSNNLWTCSCGNTNDGRFCSRCGREKPSGDNMLTAVFEEDNKFNGGMNPVNEIRKWSGSGIVLALAVLVSVTLLCSLIGFIIKLTTIGFGTSMIVDIVGVLFGILVCVGFWRAYMSGRNKTGRYSSGGARMLNGVLVFYQVIAYIFAILLLLLIIVMFVVTVASIQAMSGIFEEIFGELGVVLSEQLGFDIFGIIGTTGTTFFIILLVAVIIAFVLIILFFTFVRRFARTAIRRLEGVSNEYKSATPAAVFLFIVGICLVVSVIMSFTSPGFMFGGASKWLSIISSIASALTFIFAGVLAVTFNGAQKRALMQ